MKTKEPDFAFGKKLGIAECLHGDPIAISKMIARLMFCMQETNKLHSLYCEFFRLDFRPPSLDETLEFPMGTLILEMKWGSKEELKKVSKDEPINANTRGPARLIGC